MLSFFLAVHFVLTMAIIGLILLQKHDSDGALGSSGGGAASGVFSVRGQANLLTRATAILMSIFILNCLIMAKMVKRSPTKESIIDLVAKESVFPVVKEEKNEPAPATKGAAPVSPNRKESVKDQGKKPKTKK
ncbi:MAG: preprotein translocase subunit SecG [Holosporaceae bacterium]|jgi:preprotein translocase subunit SecG|nr:preprotein translocase subunit SecG [Holosporaceae bacterium]